jgi:poly-beta-1,6-N-acetyl-D-glucosamine synthase
LILLTDADSRPGIHWVQTMAKFFVAFGADLILGPVIIDPARKPFDQVQKLEFMSLVAASVGAAGIGRPIMAQGPNIAIRSSEYVHLVKDLDNRFDSGDDLFLLQAMNRLPGKKIYYIMHPDAIVSSKPCDSMTCFLKQRLRWASKARGYTNPFLIQTTLLVFITNLEIVAAFGLSIFGLIPYKTALLLLVIKTLADTPLLIAAMRFFRSLRLLGWLIPVQVLYPVYIGFAGILSQVKRFSWKG